MRGVKQISGSTGRMKKHRTSREFKVTAVKLATHPGIETQEVAAALNIHPFMLSRWKKEVREGKLKGPAHPNLKEIEGMEATVSEHPRIRELACPGRSGQGSSLEEGENRERPPKKSYPIQFGAKSEIFAFIDRHRHEYGIEFLCRHYGVSRSGYYAWKHRRPSTRTRANHQLLTRIGHIHARSHGTYGSPRVAQALAKQGILTSENRVARLMRTAGLQGRVVRVTRRAPGVHRFFEATDNLRVASAPPTGINQQWVGDVTFLKANGRPCFLAAVMDVSSRRIVGWAFGSDRTVNLTALAMQRAIRNRAPARALIFHSDRGIEYGAYHYRAILTKHGIRQSMNRPRCTQDNAHMESFFHSLKTEWIRGRSFATLPELEAALKAYIRFYNHHRLHSSIDYQTPEEYERLVA